MTIRHSKSRPTAESTSQGLWRVYDGSQLVYTTTTKEDARAWVREHAKKNPPTPKLGQWIKAHRVRLVKKNGRKVLEIQRTVPKRKNGLSYKYASPYVRAGIDARKAKKAAQQKASRARKKRYGY